MNTPKPHTPKGLRIATMIGVIVTIICLIPTIIFAIQCSRYEAAYKHHLTEYAQAQNEDLSVRKQIFSAEQDLADAEATKAAQEWCAAMTVDNRQKIADLITAYDNLDNAAKTKAHEQCEQMETFALAAKVFFPKYSIKVTIDSCEGSSSSATISGTISVDSTSFQSKVDAIDVWLSAGVTASKNSSDNYSTSTSIEVRGLKTDGTAQNWSGTINGSDTYCGVDVDSWWLAQ